MGPKNKPRDNVREDKKKPRFIDDGDDEIEDIYEGYYTEEW